MEEEQALIARAKRGDDEAKNRIVAAHRERVTRLCARYLGNAEDGEDAAQETFRRAFASLATFRQEAKLKTWLDTIANRVCSNARRDGKNHRLCWSLDAPVQEASDSETTLGEKLPDPSRAVEATTVDSEYSKYLLERMRREMNWSSHQWDVFIYRCLRDEPFAEIARRLGRPEASLRSTYSDMRRRLEKMAIKIKAEEHREEEGETENEKFIISRP